MSAFATLHQQVATYLSFEQVQQIAEAYSFAKTAHEGQFRLSGEPYVIHPLAVATILAMKHMDHESIIAALLHDILEDTHIDKAKLTSLFGVVIAELVDGVSKLKHMHFADKKTAQAENFRKMMLAMVRDVRVIIIKMADRLHNMETIDALPRIKQKRIARETLEIYAPIAHRLGMNCFKVNFEELGFKTLYPWRAKILYNAIKRAKQERQRIIDTITTKIIQQLERLNLLPFDIILRDKHLYSVYYKMRRKQLTFNEIMDIYGFHIEVESIDMCYRVLGALHTILKPVHGRFKDYIAIPKTNGYQALHTRLFGPAGVAIEIQIRTKEMREIAEHGIVAHWLNKTQDHANTQSYTRTREWFNNLLEMQKRTGPLEFIEHVKTDLFPDEVYVFTPKGDIIKLPRGSTVVDFAYAVHTDIGNHCVGAKINRRTAPLSTKLENGQALEIITEPSANPNPTWLNFAVTAKAKSNLRHFFKTQVPPLEIKGTEGTIVKFAECCWPIPGDPIIGVMQPHDHGLLIHVASCKVLVQQDHNLTTAINLAWEQELNRDFLVEINLLLENRRGILAEISTIIAQQQANIEHIKTELHDGTYVMITLVIGVKNRKHLADILRRLRRLPSIHRIWRSSHKIKP